MIDPFGEELLSLVEATELCPRRRGGKKPHISCLYRWTTSGCKGIVLESLQVGGTRCTSREALARFFERLTLSQRGEPLPTGRDSRVRAISRAEQELDQAGI
jgi:hypothetical protein